MDAEIPVISPGDPLPDADDVYRIVLVNQRDRKNKAIPAVRCFSLSPRDENKLSVDWARKTSPEECIARVGTTFKMGSNEYKPYDNREIYALNVGFLKTFSDIEDVIYDPIIFPVSQDGRLNNPAHSLVVFKMAFLDDQAKEPEILLKIRDHAKDRKIKVGMEELRDLVMQYRAMS